MIYSGIALDGLRKGKAIIWEAPRFNVAKKTTFTDILVNGPSYPTAEPAKAQYDTYYYHQSDYNINGEAHQIGYWVTRPNPLDQIELIVALHEVLILSIDRETELSTEIDRLINVASQRFS